MRKFVYCLIATFALSLIAAVNAHAAEPSAESCENLAKLSLDHTKITMAKVVAAGTLPRDGGRGARGRFRHQDRSVDAHDGLEREIPRAGQRRILRLH